MKRGKIAILLLVLFAFPMIQNCGTSHSGGGTSDVIVAEQLINDGWDNIKIGALTSATSNFQQALNMPLTDAQRINAMNGLGWALSKDGKILEAIPYFEVAAEKDNEAKVGLAAALIFRHQTTTDYVRAAEMLGNMPPEKFGAVHSGLSLSAAKVHALAALAYALAGDPTMAQTYINKAAALDSMMVGTTVDRIDEAFFLLGWKK
jgi:tetratricopeptide (TPR) repeat protein